MSTRRDHRWEDAQDRYTLWSALIGLGLIGLLLWLFGSGCQPPRPAPASARFRPGVARAPSGPPAPPAVALAAPRPASVRPPRVRTFALVWTCPPAAASNAYRCVVEWRSGSGGAWVRQATVPYAGSNWYAISNAGWYRVGAMVAP